MFPIRMYLVLFSTLLLMPWFEATLAAQGFEEVNFQSRDGNKIYADLYASDPAAPWVLLFHQSVSSRGEFRDIAPRLQREGFNCLAVDLRWGKEDFWNHIPNKTASKSGSYEIIEKYEASESYQLQKVWPMIWGAYEDMLASLRYLEERGFGGDKILLGSSFSAMLIFKLAAEEEGVNGLVAFSPAEYHPTEDRLLESWANTCSLPVYISLGKEEGKIKESLKRTLSKTKPVFHQSNGRHGASVLIGEEIDWPPLLKFLQAFKRKSTVGFLLLRLKRASKLWEEHQSLKPLHAFLWYPSRESPSVWMSQYDYIKNLSPEKSPEENLETFKRILQAFGPEGISDKWLSPFLESRAHAIYGLELPKSSHPLIIISGAHPLYFCGLAEHLAEHGYIVLSVPRKGIRKGQRLAYNREGAREFMKDLKSVWDHIGDLGISTSAPLSFISWSFEGIPSLELASELKAQLFLSFDSSIGYSYGKDLLPPEGFRLNNSNLKIIHFTSPLIEHGKNLNFYEEAGLQKDQIQIDQSFELAHGAFTSLASLTRPMILGENVSPLYQRFLQRITALLRAYAPPGQ